jgi:tetratricopeptide (TPR) repeat protein
MQVKDIFLLNHSTKIFKITGKTGDENILDWIIEPTDLELIPEGERHFIVLAKQIFVGRTTDCYMDINMPERITDFVIKLEDGKVSWEYYYKRQNKIIPAVASDGYGFYDLYYAKDNPQIGIDVLRQGLTKSKSKSATAEDLGYILTDENRLEEAVEAFLISEKAVPTSHYIFNEIAQLYKELGQTDKQLEYENKFKNGL